MAINSGKLSELYYKSSGIHSAELQTGERIKDQLQPHVNMKEIYAGMAEVFRVMEEETIKKNGKG